jgi:hypothetical protein
MQLGKHANALQREARSRQAQHALLARSSSPKGPVRTWALAMPLGILLLLAAGVASTPSIVTTTAANVDFSSR